MVVTELLEEFGHATKIPPEVCKIPFLKTTEGLRIRLKDFPDAFNSTMKKLAVCVASHLATELGFHAADPLLTSKLGFDSEQLGQALCERIPAELACPADAMPPPPPDVLIVPELRVLPAKDHQRYLHAMEESQATLCGALRSPDTPCPAPPWSR